MPESPCLIDTSLLVRYLAGDNAGLRERARFLIESDSRLGITGIVLLETSFVLQRLYGHSREVVVDALVEFISRENAVGVGIDLRKVASRLLLCRPSTTVSFGDALLAATGASYGVNEAYSFDEKLDRSGLTVRRC